MMPRERLMRLCPNGVTDATARRTARGASPAPPNKPMVPTAPTSLNRYSLPSRRRHIGQPLDKVGRLRP